MFDNYEEDEDYGCGMEKEKTHYRPKKSKKNQRDDKKSRHGDVYDFADEMNQEENGLENEKEHRQEQPSAFSSPAPSTYHPQNTFAGVPQHHEHHFGPNTLEFKGNKIDFDGVQTLFPITGHQGEFQTYGIKFIFVGKGGFYKIVWYGSDKTGRDVDLATAAKKKGISL